MKKTMKSVIAVFAMVLVLGCAGVTAEAATKKDKMTFYVSEQFGYSYSGMGKVKSVKSSKKSVVTAKKKKVNGTTGCVMTAKKKGKAKVTVKGTRGTWIHTITVKAKPKFSLNVTRRADSYFTVELKTPSVYVDDVKVAVQLLDAAGNVLDTEMVYFYKVGKKNTVAEDMYVSSSIADKVASYNWAYQYDRSPDYKYSDYSKKVTWKCTKSNGYLNIKTTTKYKGKNWI